MTKHFETKLDFAKCLTLEADELAKKLYKEKNEDFISSKGLQDFVTVADRKVEELMRSMIQKHYPSDSILADSILGEEEGISSHSQAMWVVDPIDGTTNYMRGLPDWAISSAISIAYCEGEQILIAAIYAPAHDELCWAKQGEGGFCNGHKLSVPGCSDINQALLPLGRSGWVALANYLAVIEQIIESHMEYRRNGSTAVSLMMVAQGRAEGDYEEHLNAWDAFAGILLIREAGEIVNCVSLNDFVSEGAEVFACVKLFQDRVYNQITYKKY